VVIVDVDVVVVVVVDVAVSLTDAAFMGATHAAKRTTTATFIFASIFSPLGSFSLSLLGFVCRDCCSYLCPAFY